MFHPTVAPILNNPPRCLFSIEKGFVRPMPESGNTWDKTEPFEVLFVKSKDSPTMLIAGGIGRFVRRHKGQSPMNSDTKLVYIGKPVTMPDDLPRIIGAYQEAVQDLTESEILLAADRQV